MKKKIIIASAVMFFALATMFNINALQSNNAGDISLDNIAIMAQAKNETSGQGTLYGNQAGTRFCCCAGSNSCGAAWCPGC